MQRQRNKMKMSEKKGGYRSSTCNYCRNAEPLLSTRAIWCVCSAHTGGLCVKRADCSLYQVSGANVRRRFGERMNDAMQDVDDVDDGVLSNFLFY